MTTPHSVYVSPIPEDVVPGRRLGRHVSRDSRSLAYPYRAVRLFSALADQLWTRHIPILEQLIGSCTGNAETGELGTDPFFTTLPAGTVLDEAFAEKLYSEATRIDPFPGEYPPDDTGSDGTSVCQAAKNDHFISGYTHANNVSEMADALQDGPVIIGINWYSSFDEPSSDGTISISPNAWVRGGHEIVVRGVQIANKMFLADNSWGPDWGYRGGMKFSWDTMLRLFDEYGDCTVSLPITTSPPPPQPPADADHLFWFGGQDQMMKRGGLQNWCRSRRTRADLIELKHDALLWAKAKGFPP